MGGGGVVQLSLYRRVQGICNMDTSYIKKKKKEKRSHGLAFAMVGHRKFEGNSGHQTNRMIRNFEGSMHKEYEPVQNLEGYIKVTRTELVQNCAELKQNEQKLPQKNFAGSIRKETPRTEFVQNWAESEQNEEN
jgi:hypothetical protein